MVKRILKKYSPFTIRNLFALMVVIVIITIWELSARNNLTLKFFISSPSESLKYAIVNYHNILNSALITSVESILGFLIAIFFSFIIMFICLIYPPILKFILPIFITSQILPIITLAPLFIILFGMGLLSKIAMVVLMCFFPIFINFSHGVNSVPSEIHELLYIYNTRKMFRIFKIILPLSTPHIFAGLKISTTMAIMGAIVAEFVGAKDGLGKNLYLAPKNSLPELMICSILLTIVLGWLLFRIVVIAEGYLGKWYNQKTQP